MRDYYSPKRTYVGQYTQDKHNTYFEHGLGYYNVPLTGKCAGEFDHNTVTGVAVKTWEHGETYVGQYLLNKKQGVGLHVWPTGARYYGEFHNNKPCGYGILETAHKGVKFIGRVDGMIAEPREGQWYLNDKPCGLDEADVDGLGCRTLKNGTVVNAVGERTEKFTDKNGEIVTRHTEKNIVTETRYIEPYNFMYGKRDTTHYGDWIRTYTGHFLSGRYHGRSLVQQLGTPDYESNWILGDPVQFETYSSIAFDEASNYTRSIERRMTRRYCAIYDLAVSHLLRTNPIYNKQDDFTIVEFGVGKGEHLQFLQKLFPRATIIGVDNLSSFSIAKDELEKQQIDDIKIAKRIPGIHLELEQDCYDPQVIKRLIEKYGPIDLAIHDATHTSDAWNKLGAIRNGLHPNRGLLISEEMCCNNDATDKDSIDWHQIELAKDQMWRIWDLRPLGFHTHTNSFIGIWSPAPKQFHAGALSLYEIYKDGEKQYG